MQNLGSLASQAKPLATNLSALLRSFKYEGGINRLLDVVFYLAGSANGYDKYGHYVRTRLVLTSCTTYATQNQLSCTANFRKDFGGVTTPALPTSGGSPSATSTANTSQLADLAGTGRGDRDEGGPQQDQAARDAAAR